MSKKTPQANKDLFNEAKDHYLPKEILNRAQTGTISERLTYVLSIGKLSVNQMCKLCTVTKHDVITFLFKYKHNLTIDTDFVNNCYYFTTSTKFFKNHNL